MLTLPAIAQSYAYLNGSPAAIRLLVEQRGWLKRQSDIRGYHASVAILRHPKVFGRQVEIVIDFDDNIAGEPL